MRPCIKCGEISTLTLGACDPDIQGVPTCGVCKLPVLHAIHLLLSASKADRDSARGMFREWKGQAKGEGA